MIHGAYSFVSFYLFIYFSYSVVSGLILVYLRQIPNLARLSGIIFPVLHQHHDKFSFLRTNSLALTGSFRPVTGHFCSM